jgi:Zn-dependent M32 family carboxypeptidase
VAFLYEHVIGRSDAFLKIILDAGLSDCGYTLEMVRAHVRRIDRQTKRIETNPLRHMIDIHICDQFERAMINEDVEAEDAELYWNDLIKPYNHILPDHYPFYWDVHQMTGIYGDRASYNPGVLAAFQLAEMHNIDLTNLYDFVTEKFALCEEKSFDRAVESLTGRSLSTSAFMNWSNSFYS